MCHRSRNIFTVVLSLFTGKGFFFFFKVAYTKKGKICCDSPPVLFKHIHTHMFPWCLWNKVLFVWCSQLEPSWIAAFHSWQILIFSLHQKKCLKLSLRFIVFVQYQANELERQEITCLVLMCAMQHWLCCECLDSINSCKIIFNIKGMYFGVRCFLQNPKTAT